MMIKNHKFEKYVHSIIKEYSPKLLLERHIWELRGALENQDALMECKFNYPYLNVILLYDQSIVDKWIRKEDIVPYIVHEMCHPITDPLYAKATSRFVNHDDIKDERELLTDYICNIVLRK